MRQDEGEGVSYSESSASHRQLRAFLAFDSYLSYRSIFDLSACFYPLPRDRFWGQIQLSTPLME